MYNNKQKYMIGGKSNPLDKLFGSGLEIKGELNTYFSSRGYYMTFKIPLTFTVGNYQFERIAKLGEGSYGQVHSYKIIRNRRPYRQQIFQIALKIGDIREDVNILKMNQANGLCEIVNAKILKLKLNKIFVINCLIMEKLDGNLSDITNLKKRLPFNDQIMMNIIQYLLEVCGCFYKKKLYYTDLKLLNLLYRNEGTKLYVVSGDIGSVMPEHSNIMATFYSWKRFYLHGNKVETRISTPAELHDILYCIGFAILQIYYDRTYPDSITDWYYNPQWAQPEPRIMIYKQLIKHTQLIFNKINDKRIYSIMIYCIFSAEYRNPLKPNDNVIIPSDIFERLLNFSKSTDDASIDNYIFTEHGLRINKASNPKQIANIPVDREREERVLESIRQQVAKEKVNIDRMAIEDKQFKDRQEKERLQREEYLKKEQEQYDNIVANYNRREKINKDYEEETERLQRIIEAIQQQQNELSEEYAKLLVEKRKKIHDKQTEVNVVDRLKLENLHKEKEELESIRLKLEAEVIRIGNEKLNITEQQHRLDESRQRLNIGKQELANNIAKLEQDRKILEQEVDKVTEDKEKNNRVIEQIRGIQIIIADTKDKLVKEQQKLETDRKAFEKQQRELESNQNDDQELYNSIQGPESQFTYKVNIMCKLLNDNQFKCQSNKSKIEIIK